MDSKSIVLADLQLADAVHLGEVELVAEGGRAPKVVEVTHPEIVRVHDDVLTLAAQDPCEVKGQV